MKRQLLATVVVVLGAINTGCQARFSSAGKDIGNGAQDAPGGGGKPEEPTWDGGYVNLDCEFSDGKTTFALGRIGVLDRRGFEFLGESYRWVKFADEGWMAVWLSFPGHTVDGNLVTQPKEVEVEYYIFLRPDWRTPENFHEIRRSRRFSFQKDQATIFQWKFTDFKLDCQVLPSDGTD